MLNCLQCGRPLPKGHKVCPLCGSMDFDKAFRPRWPWLVGSGLFRSVLGPALRGSLTAIFLFLAFAILPALLLARSDYLLAPLLYKDNVVSYAIVAPILAIALRNFKIGAIGSFVTGFFAFILVYSHLPMQLFGFWTDDPGHLQLQLFIRSFFGGFLGLLLYLERETVDW